MKQFVLPFIPADNKEYNLKGSDYHYLIHVRRYTEKSEIPAIDGNGEKWKIQFLKISADSCRIRINREKEKTTAPPGTSVILMPAMLKGKNMDLVIRQAVESGASEILPVITEYTQIKINGEYDIQNKMTRWNKIITSAVQQSGAEKITKVEKPVKLHVLMKNWNKKDIILFFHEKKINNPPLHKILEQSSGNIGILIGPEGGFSPSEVSLLMDNNAVPVYLGKRVLRAETAAVFALGAVTTLIREKPVWQTV